MIWTFKIELLFGMYAENKWRAEIELDSALSLESLHYAIQRAVEFDDDHLEAASESDLMMKMKESTRQLSRKYIH